MNDRAINNRGPGFLPNFKIMDGKSLNIIKMQSGNFISQGDTYFEESIYSVMKYPSM